MADFKLDVKDGGLGCRRRFIQGKTSLPMPAGFDEKLAKEWIEKFGISMQAILKEVVKKQQ